MKKFSKILLLLGALGLTNSLLADGTQTANASANIVDACYIGSVSNISLGNYDPYSSDDLDWATNAGDNFGTISYKCTYGTSYTFTLDDGLHANGTQRRLLSENGDTLNYTAYVDHASGTWTEDDIGYYYSLNYATTGVYAIVSSGQDPSLGSYSDTLTLSMNY